MENTGHEEEGEDDVGFDSKEVKPLPLEGEADLDVDDDMSLELLAEGDSDDGENDADDDEEGEGEVDFDDKDDDTDEDTESFMKETDSNQDGMISLLELHQHADHELAGLDEHLEGDELADFQKDTAEDKSRMAKVFAEADLDKNSLIDGKELPAMLKAMDTADADEADEGEAAEDREDAKDAEDADQEDALEEKEEKELEEKEDADDEEDDADEDPESFMKEADINKDGMISLSELQQHADQDFLGEGLEGKELAAFQHDTAELKSRMAAIFAKADLDKNSLVDATELPAMLKVMDAADADMAEDGEDAVEEDAGEEGAEEEGEGEEEEDEEEEKEEEKEEGDSIAEQDERKQGGKHTLV